MSHVDPGGRAFWGQGSAGARPVGGAATNQPGGERG